MWSLWQAVVYFAASADAEDAEIKKLLPLLLLGAASRGPATH
jgi:hypothetical protein